MTRPGADARRTTMLDKLLEAGAGGFGTGPGLASVLESAIPIEASEPFSYLRERTQHVHEEGPGGDLSAADFPDCHPEGLAVLAELAGGRHMDAIPPVFFEGSFPADRATAFDPRPGETAGMVSTDLESVNAGVLVFCGEDLPERVGISLPDQTRYVLRVVPYVDIGAGATNIHGPPIMWLIPVSEHGEVLVEPIDKDIAIFVYPTPEGSDWDQDQGARIVHQSLRSMLYGVLFAMCCANSTANSTTECVTAGSPSSAGIGTLHISALTQKLDREGKAKELGLGHALTVCREAFGPLG
ncbi:hypothetical protein [Rubrobacter aplysinae]|uniref:hypothetical protein n=1 Tax=Rubrobacter aplysinae TaxID=909625 RepID=UPI00064BFB8B|nr:hypothetical protein [Rubrobacter aplysinae]